jgi:hypothetical protein
MLDLVDQVCETFFCWCPIFCNLERKKLSLLGGQNVNKVNTKVDLRFNVESCDWIPAHVKPIVIENLKVCMIVVVCFSIYLNEYISHSFIFTF